VALSRQGQEAVRPGEGASYDQPMCTGDISLVYALRLSESGIEIEAIRIDRRGLEDGPVRFGATVAHKTVQPRADRLLGHQIAATVLPPVPRRGTIVADNALAFFDPRLSRMVVFRLETNDLEPLAPGSFAAIASQDPARPGFFCSTSDKGMVFVPTEGKARDGEVPAVRVLPSPYVPRQIIGTPQSMLLFGPVKGRADELEVVKLVIGPPTEQAPAPGAPSQD
jgi:hypothetical protein